MDKELHDAAASFVETFELVFHEDWEFTKRMIEEPSHYINNTFLRPNVENELTNWANRGNLLASYRQFKALLESTSPR